LHSTPRDLRQAFIQSQLLTDTEMAKEQLRRVHEFLSHPENREATLQSISDRLLPDYGAKALSRMRLSKMLDGRVLVYNHAVSNEQWSSMLLECGISNPNSKLPKESQDAVIQLSQSKAEQFFQSSAVQVSNDAIFISALELSMFTRRPRKAVGAKNDSIDQRYCSATVLLAMSHQHGCIAVDFCAGAQSRVAVGPFLVDVMQKLRVRDGGHRSSSTAPLTVVVSNQGFYGEIKTINRGVDVVLLPAEHATANPSAVVLETLKHVVVAECAGRGVWKGGPVADWESLVRARELHLVEIAKAAWGSLAMK